MPTIPRPDAPNNTRIYVGPNISLKYVNKIAHINPQITLIVDIPTVFSTIVDS